VDAPDFNNDTDETAKGLKKVLASNKINTLKNMGDLHKTI
jgi:hypothetical protein